MHTKTPVCVKQVDPGTQSASDAHGNAHFP